jgi:ABC-type Fe3+-hydroxamate transport system substrate-binding protein
MSGQPPSPPPPPHWAPLPAPPARPGKPGLRARWWFIAAIAVVALLIGIGIGSSGSSTNAKSTPAVTTTATATATVNVTTTPTRVVATRTVQVRVTYTPPLQNQISDGTYVVGTDIPAGIYKSDGQSDDGIGCYWARLASLNTSDIIDNGNISGPTTTQIRPNDKAFLIEGGCTWSRIG